ncbi:Peptidase, M23/M37 family [hydrothermal vent metagenome]|uniref:Peptidase, M23/M37 family n=1 Tax=hydrothermal vent metagenome TaxID=652676 RepID=A0A1W1CU99_9ZZZZ
MKYRRKKKSGSKVIILLVLLALIAGAGYVYTAPEFERVSPGVEGPSSLFWNRKDPLRITLKDNIALKSFKLTLSDGTHSLVIGQGTFSKEIKEQTLLINYPKSKILNPKAKILKLKVVVTDKSKWKFMRGNSSTKVLTIHVDYQRPNVNILANSYSITQGGSALVVFQAEDENLDRLYVEAGGVQFQAQPYKKEGYYVALIAWPFRKNSFNAKIIAVDIAKNKRVVAIPFYVKKHNYRVSWIRATDKFIDGKITDLASSNPEYANIDDKIERLKAINETMRLNNEVRIHTLSKGVSSKMLQQWKINKFYPLENSQKVASYGDERHYYYQNKENEVSRSYHVGYDLASTKMAKIRTSNAGTVVFAGENGIYGNMPMIDHGLGLYSLYGHCSQLLVSEGERVNAGDIIAKTGTSGLALGDHLHFGLVIQGVEVRPIEWFDQAWIHKNIENIFKEADKIILGD